MGWGIRRRRRHCISTVLDDAFPERATLQLGLLGGLWWRFASAHVWFFVPIRTLQYNTMPTILGYRVHIFLFLEKRSLKCDVSVTFVQVSHGYGERLHERKDNNITTMSVLGYPPARACHNNAMNECKLPSNIQYMYARLLSRLLRLSPTRVDGYCRQ